MVHSRIEIKSDLMSDCRTIKHIDTIEQTDAVQDVTMNSLDKLATLDSWCSCWNVNCTATEYHHLHILQGNLNGDI